MLGGGVCCLLIRDPRLGYRVGIEEGVGRDGFQEV